MKSRKELIGEYKTKKFKIGVFQIRNSINGKVFIGGSLNLDAIWNRNRMELNFGSHKNEMLQKEWIEFGEENFRYEILSEIQQKDGDKVDYKKEVNILTEMYINELKPFADKGYNKTKI
jgi:hypothetical protein